MQAFSFRSRSWCAAVLFSLGLNCAASLGWPSPARAQQRPNTSSDSSVCTASGFGNVHHPVKTSNPEAQKLFDHGMALDYGFNHNQAQRCFQRAAQLDPKMAMAYWGIALVLGTNYNMPVDPDREKEAYGAVQKALKLSANGPANERDYIQALARRYTDSPDPDYDKLEGAYHRRENAGGLQALSQRTRCRNPLRRERHELASLETVRPQRQAGARHDGDRHRIAICFTARSEPFRRESFLHSRRGGLQPSRDGTRFSAQTGAVGPGFRTSGAHAGAGTSTSAPAITRIPKRPMKKRPARTKPTSRRPTLKASIR